MGYDPQSSYSINGQAIFQGGSRNFTTLYQNGTANTIPVLTPVSTDTNGNLAPTDITSESSFFQFLGLAYDSIVSGASGRVVSGGRLENVTTGFSVGDPIYIGPGGILINQKPDIGVAGFETGYFIFFIGVLVKNEFNPANTDIQLLFDPVGQL